MTAGRRLSISGGLTDLTTDGYDRLEPVPWPVLAGNPGGTRRLFGDGRFYHPDRWARLIAVRPHAPRHVPDEEFPLVLNTGRIRDQWHTMTPHRPFAAAGQSFSRTLRGHASCGCVELWPGQWCAGTRRHALGAHGSAIAHQRRDWPPLDLCADSLERRNRLGCPGGRSGEPDGRCPSAGSRNSNSRLRESNPSLSAGMVSFSRAGRWPWRPSAGGPARRAVPSSAMKSPGGGYRVIGPAGRAPCWCREGRGLGGIRRRQFGYVSRRAPAG